MKRIIPEQYQEVNQAFLSVPAYAVHAGVGRATARTIAQESGSLVKIGKRLIVNVKMADDWMMKEKVVRA